MAGDDQVRPVLGYYRIRIAVIAVSIIASTGLLAGCTSVATVDGDKLRVGSDAFSDYVESVFRRQNALATELTFAMEQEDFDSPRYVELESAELALLDACSGLNEIATERQSGGGTGGLRALRAARRAPDCERAALAVESLLAASGSAR